MLYELVQIRRRFKYFDLREELVTDEDFPDLIYRTKSGPIRTDVHARAAAVAFARSVS